MRAGLYAFWNERQTYVSWLELLLPTWETSMKRHVLQSEPQQRNPYKNEFRETPVCVPGFRMQSASQIGAVPSMQSEMDALYYPIPPQIPLVGHHLLNECRP